MKFETSRYRLNLKHTPPPSLSKKRYKEMCNEIDALNMEHSNGSMPEGEREIISQYRADMRANRRDVYLGSVDLKRYGERYPIRIEHSCDSGESLAHTIRGAVSRIIQSHRRRMRLIEPATRSIAPGVTFEFTGLPNEKFHPVFSKPGQVYKLCVKRKVKNLYNPKVPKTLDRHIGIELEFCAPISESDLAMKLWKRGFDSFVQIKEDRSLRPKDGENGFELALLLPERNYKKSLKMVCKFLDEIKAVAENRRCGLHVHVDMRRRKKEIVYNNFVACQEVLSKFLDPHRKNNEFCRFVTSRTFPTKFTGRREERYKAVNAAAYYKYKTLEIRMHEGSVDYVDIANWIDLLIKIANHRVKIKKDITELTSLRKRVSMDTKMNGFFQDKTCFWQVRAAAGTQTTAGNDVLFRVAPLEVPTERVGVATYTLDIPADITEDEE